MIVLRIGRIDVERSNRLHEDYYYGLPSDR